METISLKLEKTFLRDMEKTMKNHRYSTKTEFIREAIRDKLTNLEKEDMIQKLVKLKGSEKNIKRMTKQERNRFFEEFIKKDTSDIFRKYGLD